jgi:hypothetical protein
VVDHASSPAATVLFALIGVGALLVLASANVAVARRRR